MKQLIVILATFVICFLTSWLLSLDWVLQQWPRYALVCALMVIELIVGYIIVKSISKQNIQSKHNP